LTFQAKKIYEIFTMLLVSDTNYSVTMSRKHCNGNFVRFSKDRPVGL